MSREEFFKVPKLNADGSNWVTFKDRFRWAIDARGMLDQLENVVEEPIDPTALSEETSESATADSQGGETHVQSSELQYRNFLIRRSQWRTAEATIKQCIASMVPDSVFNRIKTKKTAKGIWDALASIFQERSLMVAIDLRQKMQSVKCGDSEDVRTHFEKLANTRERLASMGVSLSDAEYANILIGSLPIVYDPTISSITAAAKLTKKPIDPDDVIVLVTDEYDRRDLKSRAKSKKDEKDAAFYAGGGSKGGKQGGKQGGRKDITCHNCSKRGHVKADCWAKGGGKEGQGPKKGGGSGSATGATATTSAAAATEGEGVWIVIDEDVIMEDWASDHSDETDWSLLSDNSEGEMDDSPPIPDAHPSDADRLRSIMLSRDVANICLDNDDNDFYDDLPSLETVSNSTDDAQSRLDDELLADESEDDDDSVIFIYDLTDDGVAPVTSFAGAVLAGTETTCNAESELYDSGASRHMTPFRHRLINFTPIASRPITAADKRVFHATGKGDMRIEVPNGNTTTTILLKDVLYAPDMGITIVSISRIASAGFATLFRANFCRIFDSKQRRVGHVPVTSNGLYRVDHGEVASTASTRKGLTLKQLHCRMGHIAPEAVRKLVREGRVNGVNLEEGGDFGSCDSCEYAKTTRKPLKKERSAPRATQFGDEIHSDVWGPSPLESIFHHKYYTSFIDDHTRYSRITLLRKKDETFESYKHFEAWAATQHNVKIKRLRSDRGGEYLGDEFTAHLQAQGTERRLTTHDTPEHNGVAEALNRRILERVRAMLHQSGLPKFLWGEAVLHANWLKNRTSTRALNNMTPYEALTGSKPNLSNLHEWGTKVWVHDDTNSKLEGRSNIGRWVGYDNESTHAHRIYWPGRRTISVERNVKFDENDVLIPSIDDMPLEGEIGPEDVNQPVDNDNDNTKHEPSLNPTNNITTTQLPPSRAPSPEVPERPKRAIKPSAYVNRLLTGEGFTQGTYKNGRIVGKAIPTGLQARDDVGALGEYWEDLEIGGVEFAMGAAALEAEGMDPGSLAEAKGRSDWPMWQEAMQKELESLRKANTWTVVKRPSGKNIVGSKWVFHIKKDANGHIAKYKARLVARGFTQVYGVDYTETFAPVAKLASLRTILAIAARHDWPIEVFDFNSAFLNGELDEEIFMQLPPDFEGCDPRRYVARLNKALYGLKQGGRTWYKTLCRTLEELGFKRAEYDHGVFYSRSSAGTIILAIHVDDCTITGTSQTLLDEHKQRINKCYPMTDLGPISWLLGIQVTRNREAHTITLSQRSYIDSILARFNFTDAKPLSIPMDPNISFSKDQCPTTPDDIASMRRVPYREAIGSLMYASVGTRPDISFAVSTLSQFLDNPGNTHWEAVKRVFRYLLGTKDLQLTFGGGKHGLEGYTDADGASQEHRRAISGYAFIIDGGAVSWSSRKQELVTYQPLKPNTSPLLTPPRKPFGFAIL
jgi:transposase InsO family protein